MGLTLGDITSVYSDEAAAYELMELTRWPDGPVCPHCGSTARPYLLQAQSGERKTRKGNVTYRRLWKCAGCRKQFSVLVGTIFEGSHIPLGKWLMAIHEMCTAKNGVAAYELHRKLGITNKSAWFMAHRIRYAMAWGPLAQKLQGIVEADETYFGPKVSNLHADQREARRERNTGTLGDKTPVVALVERGGEVRSMVLKHVTAKNLGQALHEHVERSATLQTDDLPTYKNLGKAFAAHETVGHRMGEYVRGTAGTNTVEGFFGQLKRSIDGTHHHVSAQHLGRYLGEFDWRYNTRKTPDAERVAATIRRVTGKRLSYN